MVTSDEGTTTLITANIIQKNNQIYAAETFQNRIGVAKRDGRKRQ